MRRLWGGAVLAAGVVAAIAGARANIYESQPLLPVPADAPRGFDAVLRMVTIRGILPDPEGHPAEGTTGLPGLARESSTATMISPCYAITSYHGVFGDPSNVLMGNRASTPATEGYNVLLMAGPQGRDLVGKARPVLWGPFDETWRAGDDWGLLEVSPCLGLTRGWADLNTRLLTETIPERLANNDPWYMAVGYPINLSGGVELTYDPRCEFYAYGHDQEGLYFSCSVWSGMSGGPVAILGADQVLQITALISTELSPSDEQRKAGNVPDLSMPSLMWANIGAGVDRFLAGVFDFIMTDFARSGHINPARAPVPQ